MSQNTPIKQDRIERHLARQRGAGVRSITTEFGFSFGVPLEPVNQRPIPPLEPPAKRRKIENSNQKEAESNSGTILDAGVDNDGSRKKSISDVKARACRRFDTIVEEDSTEVKQTVSDDSFPAMKTAGKRARGRPKKSTQHAKAPKKGTERLVPSKERSRRGRPKKPTIISEGPEEDLLRNEPATETSIRPRRRAAASAMVKVTEGFIEEDVPIDNKRREVEPESKSRRARKNVEIATTTGERAMQQEKFVLDNNVPSQDDAVDGITMPKGRRGRKQAELATKTEDPITQQDNMVLDDNEPSRGHAPEDAPESPRPPARGRCSRKAVAKHPSEGSDKRQLVSTKPKRGATTAVKDASGDSSLRKEANPIRKPLGETHTNATIRSVSPEKAQKPSAERPLVPGGIEPDSAAYEPRPTLETTKAKRTTAKEAKDVRKRKGALGIIETGYSSRKDPPEAIIDSADNEADAAIQEKSSAATRRKKKKKKKKKKQTVEVTSRELAPPKSSEITNIETRTLNLHSLGAVHFPGHHETRETTSFDTREERPNKSRTKPPLKDHDYQDPSKGVDEDLDWLLKEPSKSQRQARSMRQTANSRKLRARQNRSRDEDDSIDLDDLLSNIASFVPPGTKVTGGRRN